MNNYFQSEDYVEVVNYARNITESACNYIYYQLKKRKNSQGTLFPKLIRVNLNLMCKELQIEKKNKDVSEQCDVCIDSIVELFQKLAQLEILLLFHMDQKIEQNLCIKMKLNL